MEPSNSMEVPFDRGPRARWKAWLRRLRQSRTAWAAHRVGRKRCSGNRLFVNRLQRGLQSALARLAFADVLFLAPRFAHRRKLSHSHAVPTF